MDQHSAHLTSARAACLVPRDQSSPNRTDDSPGPAGWLPKAQGRKPVNWVRMLHGIGGHRASLSSSGSGRDDGSGRRL